MFRNRVFGTPDAFHLSLEYGHGTPAVPTSASTSPELAGHHHSSHNAVRLPVALARLEFGWTSAEPEHAVVERFAQCQSDLLLSHVEERVCVQLELESIPHAAYYPEEQSRVRLQLAIASSPPALRCVQFSRAHGTIGNASQSLLVALLKHCDLSGVWKVKSAEGLGAWWANCVEPPQWASLRSLNISSCGLSVLPPVVGELAGLRMLRASHNKLGALPAEVGRLRELEVLAADHNQLTAIPVELRHCVRLRELNLENNRLATPVLDLRELCCLQSLQLFGNPLEFLPELSPCSALRSLSLANVRIMADAGYQRWEVEVAAASAYANYVSRAHRLSQLFGLIFRRSSLQHPLLAGALAKLAEDKSNCELIAREDVALQQLVPMALGQDRVVVAQAAKLLACLGSDEAGAHRLLRHNVLQAVTALVNSGDEDSQLNGLRVLTSLASGAEDRPDKLLPPHLLARLLELARTHTAPEVQCAALGAMGAIAFDPATKARLLALEGLMQLLMQLAGRQGAKQDKLKLHAIRLLAILGQNEQVRIALNKPPVRGRGIRILAMDGGGMKGMTMVELLRNIEARTGRRIAELFDVIGGTSTGGLLAVELGVVGMSLDQCDETYRSLGQKVFNQSTVVEDPSSWRESLSRLYAASSQNMRIAVYGHKHDAAPYEQLLKEFSDITQLGCVSDSFIDASVLGGPHVFVVATLASMRPAEPFAFRSYELPLEVEGLARQIKACRGSSKHQVWQAVRASSAAPYYLDDFICGPHRFQDGAASANNPALIALQQARLLYPDLPVDVLVSLGVGNPFPSERGRGMSSVLDTGAVLVECACTTDRVDEALSTTLPMVPGMKYYRFSPRDARCGMELDDINPESWKKLLAAAREYCEQPDNAARFDELCSTLVSGSGGASAAAEGRIAGEQIVVVGAGQAALGSVEVAADASPRLGFRKGLLLVESPRSTFPAASTHVEAVAATLAALPQLLRRCSLACEHQASAAAPTGGSWEATVRGAGGMGASTLQQLPSIGNHIISEADAGAIAYINEGTADAVSADLHVGTAPADDKGNDTPTSGSWLDMLFPWQSAASKTPPQPPQLPQQQQASPSPSSGVPGAAAASAAAAAAPGGAAAVPQAMAQGLHSLVHKVSDAHSGARTPPRWPTPPRLHTPPESASPAQRPQPGLLSTAATAAASALSAQRPRLPPKAASIPGQEPSRAAGAKAAAGRSTSEAPVAAGGLGPASPPQLLPQRGSRGSLSRASSYGSDVSSRAGNQAEGASSQAPAASPWGEAGRGMGPDVQTQGGAGVAGPSGRLGELSGVLRQVAPNLGVVHLALHTHANGLVADWQHEVFSVTEPGPEAKRLLAALTNEPSTSATLSQLLGTSSCHTLHDGTLLSVLAQQQVRTSQGQLVTSWLLQATSAASCIGVAQLLPLLGQLQGMLVTSSACLPEALVHALLRSGVRAVVAAAAPLAGDAQAAAAFFGAVYRALYEGEGVVAAIRAAEALVPQLAGAYHCYQLSS